MSLLRAALLTALAAAALLAQPTRGIRNKLSAGDFYSTESILEAHRLEKGADDEYKEALAWVARGAAMARDWDAATRYAAQLRKLSAPASYGHGTAIEVEAQVLEGRGRKKEALRFLEREMTANSTAPVAFRSRIRKRWNQIGLTGRPAPDFDNTLAPLKGKPVVLFLWAEWCGDCKAQAPAFVNVARKYGPRGVAFVAPTRFYETKDRDAERKRIEQQWSTTYKNLPVAARPVSEEAMVLYGVSATPTFAIVDRKGIVRFYSPTRLTEERLAAEIEKVLR